MAFVLNDRVKETTTSTGTGTINLAGAETGFETFVAGVGNSNTCYYCIAHQSADEFEVGIGTVTDASPDTLSRTTIISSSNSDSAVDFSAGTKDVFCTLPASKAVFFDESSGSSDVAIGSRGTNPMGLSMTGTVLALTEQTNVASFQMDGAQASRIDMGSGPGTRQFIIYTDTSNYSELKRTDAKPILFGTDNTERFRILQGGGIQLAASNDISNASGDFTLDIAGIINLDADNGGNINLKDGGTLYGTFQKENDDLRIISNVSDGDIIFRGNDGGSYINALTLDMSNGGAATFNNGVTATYNGTYQGTIATSAQFGTNGWINDTNGTNRFYFTASGGATYIKINSYIYFQDSGGSNRFSIDGSGNGVFSGNVTAYGSPSDIRLKENVEVIDNALDKVKQLKGITYDLKSDGNRLTGLIAQDLEKVLPEAVYTEKDLETEEEHLAIRYGNTVGLLVEAIKEQQEQIETLTAKVKELEDK